MKMPRIKDLTLAELAAKSRDLRQEMFNLRLQQASSQLEKPARLRSCAGTWRALKPAFRNCATKRRNA